MLVVVMAMGGVADDVCDNDISDGDDDVLTAS